MRLLKRSLKVIDIPLRVIRSPARRRSKHVKRSSSAWQ